MKASWVNRLAIIPDLNKKSLAMILAAVAVALPGITSVDGT